MIATIIVINMIEETANRNPKISEKTKGINEPNAR